jgi:hypothetical protein
MRAGFSVADRQPGTLEKAPTEQLNERVALYAPTEIPSDGSSVDPGHVSLPICTRLICSGELELRLICWFRSYDRHQMSRQYASISFCPLIRSKGLSKKSPM